MTPERLLVFVRQPEIGRVKTRLARGIGKRRALSVYTSLLKTTLALARAQARAGRVVEVWVAPGSRSRTFARTRGRGLTCLPQPDGGLGRRLKKAFDRAWMNGARRVVAIGSDCPTLRRDHLEETFRCLRRLPAVLGPAADGGYYLIGLSRPVPRVFAAIPWGTERVLEATRRRLRAAGLRVRFLETLRDIDREEDLTEATKAVGPGGTA